jgi:cytochrome c
MIRRTRRWPPGIARCAGTIGVVLLLARPSLADTADKVRDLVERAAAHLQEVGLERGFEDISRQDKGFVEGDLYVFCLTADGVTRANGGNPQLVGKNLNHVRDSNGVAPNLEINRIGQSQGEGWVEYLWPNPATGRVERKVVYVRRVDERTVCGSGYYMPLSGNDPRTGPAPR